LEDELEITGSPAKSAYDCIELVSVPIKDLDEFAEAVLELVEAAAGR
jgi:hypothetical protein